MGDTKKTVTKEKPEAARAAAGAEGAPARKEPFILTPENYYSSQANSLYLSNSMFKALYGIPGDPYPCEAAAMYAPKEYSEALLAGSYVDAAFESDDAFARFKEEHEAELLQKSRKAYYKFVTDADIAICRAKRDATFMSYLDGDHQKVMVGVIGGAAFKIKMDDYKEHVRITDLKYVKSAQESYNEHLRRRVTFIENYGYAIQGAIYQEIVAQNTGERLPFYIAYITKEDCPDFGVVEIPQDVLDEALEFVKLQLAARPIAEIRKSPRPCMRRSCAWCRDQKVLKGPYTWDEFQAYAQT